MNGKTVIIVTIYRLPDGSS